jgi:regulator of chromosome condensation
LKSINSLTAGTNHIVATQRTRNKSDEVTEKFYTWGSGQQSQLGRRILERRNLSSLIPTCFSIKYGSKVESKMASSGAYHTFILDGSDRVWSWGLNAQGETGIPQGVGEDNANINFPTVVESLDGYKIKDIAAGAHHSLACTEDGKLLFWGRCDGGQAGQDLDDIPKENLIFNDSGKPAIVAIPTVIPGIHAVSVGSGSDTCYAIDKDGCLWSWGFNANLQCGNGETDDVEEAEKVENTALKGKRLTGARGGGQFAVAFGVHTDE